MRDGGERVLVTGALGCIGAWTARELMADGASVVAFDRATDHRRLALIMSPGDLAQIDFVRGDLTDLDDVEQTIRSRSVTSIIHLGALQLPFCKADPPLGAMVNVGGTVNVFEAARRCSVPRVVYTSSMAIYDTTGSGETSQRIEVDTPAYPSSHYGVFKQANEGTARVYWRDDGISSIGLRPMTVYGPGRDQGLTSSPTKAIVAAVLGCRYEISFGGSTLLQYAPDVARALVAATKTSADGASVFNLDGTKAAMTQVVTAIEHAVPDARGLISHRRDPLPFPDDVATTGSDVIGPQPVTPLPDAVAATAALLGELHSRGRLVPEEHGLTISGRSAHDIASPTDVGSTR
jgi:nucleoside-diphosphate-sugar epimerase